jgi:hypothetical protein
MINYSLSLFRKINLKYNSVDGVILKDGKAFITPLANKRLKGEGSKLLDYTKTVTCKEIYQNTNTTFICVDVQGVSYKIWETDVLIIIIK